MKPEVTMIVAMTQNRVIGSRNGGIPWSLPRDKAHFRSRTSGRWLLVGRTTYLEMTGWFGDRTPIVLTRSSSFKPDLKGHRIAGSVADAVELAANNGVHELVVCGGSAIYDAALPYADRLIVTKVSFDDEVIAPVYFPDFETNLEWKLTGREQWNCDEENTLQAEMLTFQKKAKNHDEMHEVS
jgi:dihydrofolate reductase